MFSIFNRKNGLFLLILSFLTFTTFTACDDDPVSSDEDHFDAQGIYLSSGGVKVFDYYGPDITTGPNTVLGPIEINVGENGHWDVQFYNSSKVVTDGPVSDENKFLVIEIKDTSVVTVEDEHGELSKPPAILDGWVQFRYEPGVYEFHLNGIEEGGETRMRIKVYHIDHADFTTLEIDIEVGEQSQSKHFMPNGNNLFKDDGHVFNY